MEIGLHLSNFTWPGGPATLASDLGRAAKMAEDVGFTKLSVMDHVWQISMVGPEENDMLEAYTTLGYLAAKTERIELLTWVTAAIYRQPGLLAKVVTTLDVLSQGRAWLGIGAAWNEEESNGLGLPFPSTAERFERLEPGDRPQQRRLPGAGGSEHGEHLAGGQVEADPVDARHAVEADRQVADLEHVRTLLRTRGGAVPRAPSRRR